MEHSVDCLKIISQYNRFEELNVVNVNISLLENKEAFRWGLGPKEAFIQALYSDFFVLLH